MNLGKVKEVSKDFIKSLIYGKSDSRTAPQCLPYGIDSKPVKGAISVYCLTENKGKAVTLGYVKNSDITNAGENRIFATDENGNEVFSIHLKNDGTCEFGGNSDNMVRYSELEKGFNELKKNFNDFLSQQFATHTHPYMNASIPATTSVTTTITTPSQASISDAKIDNIKTN